LVWLLVLDDQADHFDYESNAWLTSDEKQRLQKLEEDREAKIQASRNKISITLDLAGRQIITTQGLYFFLFKNYFTHN
jgi:hypothetical protein